MAEATLIREYLRDAYRPTFNNFINKNFEGVRTESVHIVLENAAELQCHWMREYNNITRSARPKSQVYSKPEVASKAFLEIFEYCESLTLNHSSKHKAKHNIRLASISAAESYILRNVSALKAASSSELASTSVTNNALAESLSSELGANIPLNIQQDFRKLTDSCCIDMMCPELVSIYEKIIPQATYKKLISTCQSRRRAFEVTNKDDSSLDSVFGELAAYRHDHNRNHILALLDQQKYNEKDKQSSKYLILCMVESIAFPSYFDEANLSESTYLRKFEAILEATFADTDLKLKDGETFSRSSSRNQIFNNYQVSSGRRIDLMITSSTMDELCSIEFKKSDATTKLLRNQQSKNLRINACLLNEMHLLTRNSDIGICYMDFAGRHGYIAEVFRYEDFFVAYKIAPVHVAKSMFEVAEMNKCIGNLLRWKTQILNNQYEVIEATVHEDTKYSQVEYSRDLHRESTPEQQIRPINIMFTPTKGKKSRDVFEC
ncbi:hypothetical protein NQZ79_g8912 [Umbelopsis isabellina]|nr:hypothetical protein NQZ79_g8912 [Umbelopsis isabellina]